MKKKRIRFDEVKVGEYFKRYKGIYIKSDELNGINIKTGYNTFVFLCDKVIPVTVTIKVEEKK